MKFSCAAYTESGAGPDTRGVVGMLVALDGAFEALAVGVVASRAPPAVDADSLATGAAFVGGDAAGAAISAVRAAAGHASATPQTSAPARAIVVSRALAIARIFAQLARRRDSVHAAMHPPRMPLLTALLLPACGDPGAPADATATTSTTGTSSTTAEPASPVDAFGLQKKFDHSLTNFGAPHTADLAFGSALGGYDDHPRADGGDGLDHRQQLVDLTFTP